MKGKLPNALQEKGLDLQVVCALFQAPMIYQVNAIALLTCCLTLW